MTKVNKKLIGKQVSTNTCKFVDIYKAMQVHRNACSLIWTTSKFQDFRSLKIPGGMGTVYTMCTAYASRGKTCD